MTMSKETRLKYPISSIWQNTYDDLERKIQSCIDHGIARRNNKGPVNVFFRADDIGVPGKQFFRLIDIFSQFEVPLALAVVPVWITPKRWEILEKEVPTMPGSGAGTSMDGGMPP